MPLDLNLWSWPSADFRPDHHWPVVTTTTIFTILGLKMRQASMQQLALLRGASFRPSSRSLGRSPSLQCLQRGNAVKAFTTRPLSAVRSARDHVALLAGGSTAVPGTLPGTHQCRSLSSSAKDDDKGDGEEETGTYSEADHEHAVISTFDLLYVKSFTYTLTRSPFTHSTLWPL